MASYVLDEPFVELVGSGRKTQTIRRLHPDVPKVGERLELYQLHPTLQRQLIRDDVFCTSVQNIRFYRDVDGQIDVDISGAWQASHQVAALARAEGFRGVGQFLAYFKRKGLPFKGVLIKWQARQESPHTPPPVRECGTCQHEGKSIEDWPCRTSMNAVGLMCWEPKEAHNGTART